MSDTRKLATIRQIAEIRPIPGADYIEAVRVDGWWVVDKKGARKVGDKVVYFEIDSFLPERPQYEFLRKSSAKIHANGTPGFRLKTVKLRKQISQGLVMGLKDLGFKPSIAVGADVTELLGVIKWEPKVRGSRGANKGKRAPNLNKPFPKEFPKTDQPRVQNLNVDNLVGEYEATLKLDGTSFTAYAFPDGRSGVCSRNWEVPTAAPGGFGGFKLSAQLFVRRWLRKVGIRVWDHLQAFQPNDYGRHYLAHGIGEKVKQIAQNCGRGVAIQGELMGPGIQGNRENLSERKLYVFDICLEGLGYMVPYRRQQLVAEMGLGHVPVLDERFVLTEKHTQEDLLKYADRKSINHMVAEGVVFKRVSPKLGAIESFKVINNKFLLKEKD